jgi:hypothetical protein
VLIDSRGYVRAAGDAAGPAFRYAVRAAVAEARGQFSYIAPRSIDGKSAVPESGAAAGGPRKKPPESGGGELRDDPDAQAKLTLARTYIRTGKRTEAKRLFQEIVRDYPGTRQAKEAQEYLDGMP